VISDYLGALLKKVENFVIKAAVSRDTIEKDVI